MKKIHILILAIVYGTLTFIFHDVLETSVGAWMYTFSFLAFATGVIAGAYYVTKLIITYYFYNKENAE
ncbi:hypothetical protein [Salisediminibacterium halotolerans]|uniref:hypothetical protein n=1 Tax=Salisediminibacterium halotolerans TaxID=517425 RepID=UPI000EAE407D|nr:hypothetical protein [Salisediminibacterium halotolerans]RLJ72218.1 hypothetical protein BCL39_2113 [Actinophytocola xinjiangensis]RPE85431.1 hypothetical protein EDD67_2248 [Salisediminibacterium halotolerans]TWG33388.1 hypothetical protein BCL52_2109 [Salisediminibacterium halotolerans]GEL07081.1 hypothetical protein SHA02_04970 [Salisediminibacterium halotolerans]